MTYKKLLEHIYLWLPLSKMNAIISLLSSWLLIANAENNISTLTVYIINKGKCFLFFYFHEFDFYKFFNNRSQHLKNVKIFSCSNLFFKYFVVFFFYSLYFGYQKYMLYFQSWFSFSFSFLNFQTLLVCQKSKFLFNSMKMSKFSIFFLILHFVWLNSI